MKFKPNYFRKSIIFSIFDSIVSGYDWKLTKMYQQLNINIIFKNSDTRAFIRQEINSYRLCRYMVYLKYYEDGTNAFYANFK